MIRLTTLTTALLALHTHALSAETSTRFSGLHLHIAVASDHGTDQRSPSILVHFHGAPSTVEKSFHQSGLAGVLLVVNARGLSPAYRRPFENQSLFTNLLDHTRQQLENDGHLEQDTTWGRVDVSCFSAGFGAVRELLKNGDHVSRITGVVAADSIYASIHKEGDGRVVDATQMAPFLEFSKLAAAGKKSFFITYSQLPVEPYASTSETAHYLLNELALPEQEQQQTTQADDFAPLTGATKQGFRVAGYPGTDGEAHLQHLRNIASLWKWLDQQRRPPKD